MELSYRQQEHIGFRFVLDALSPCTPYGAELVRTLRPYAPSARAELQRQLDNLEKVRDGRADCAELLAKFQHVLMCMKDVRRIAENARERALDDVELFEIKRFLLQCEELTPMWRTLRATLGLDCAELGDTAAALDALDPEHQRVASFYVSESLSPTLRTLRREKRTLEEQIRRAAGEEKEELQRKRLLVAADEAHEEARVRGLLTEALRPAVPTVLRNTELIGEMDLLLEKAALAERWGGCKPELTENEAELAEIVNPQIAESLAQRGESFTPISVSLSEGATVLTGANMGGKSVAMKTAILNMLMAQCGLFPAARRARVPMFDGFCMISEDLESVDRGLSSFGGEIVRFNEIVRALDGGFYLILLDEFARGTNPDEGAAIVQAVTDYLNRQHSITLLATHYDGVAERGNAHYQVIGLRDLDLEQVARELRAAGNDGGVELISRHMNYGLYCVEGRQDCPRDALNICRLLGLKPEILSRIEEVY